MIGVRQSRGDLIPGFDCFTGQAISHNHSEWGRLIEGCRVKQYDAFQQVFHKDTDTLIYEIYFVGHLTP